MAGGSSRIGGFSFGKGGLVGASGLVRGAKGWEPDLYRGDMALVLEIDEGAGGALRLLSCRAA